jgi:hypothetical protein
MSETDYSKYDQLLEQAKGSAKYWVPKLCEALRRENSEMSNDDIRERVTQDCLPIWQKSTIRDALTDEYKQKEKAQAGKKGRKKQLEQAGGTLTITEEPEVPVNLRAENGSYLSTGQKLQTFNKLRPEEIVSRHHCQTNITKQEHQEASKGKTAIQGRENREEAPCLNSEGVGLIKAGSVKSISRLNRRGWAALVHRYGDSIRGMIESYSKVSIKFYLLHKSDRVLVPVTFTVDFSKMTTSLLLDERRN